MVDGRRNLWRARLGAVALLFAAVRGTTLAEAAKGGPEAPRGIELHVGARDTAYLGQPLTDLLKKFPGAKVVPFAEQTDVVTIKVAEAGLSCIAVGSTDDLKIASVGFNFDGVYEGVAEGRFRTSKGIGKGSTVNDLLEAYGQPAEILGARTPGTLKTRPAPDDPAAAQMYQYKSEDGAVTTYFLVQGNLVRRLVVNELKPLQDHVVKGRPKK